MTFLLCLLCFVLGWRFAAFLEGYQSVRRMRGDRRAAVIVGLLMALHIGIGVQ
jgi:hypothetical protein